MVGIASIEERNSEYLLSQGVLVFVLWDGCDTIEVLSHGLSSIEEAEEHMNLDFPDILLVDAVTLEKEKDRRRDALQDLYDTFVYNPSTS